MLKHYSFSDSTESDSLEQENASKTDQSPETLAESGESNENSAEETVQETTGEEKDETDSNENESIEVSEVVNYEQNDATESDEDAPARESESVENAVEEKLKDQTLEQNDDQGKLFNYSLIH